jgi:hypothetical protein
MEKLTIATNLENSIKDFKSSIVSAINEVKTILDDRLVVLDTVKKDLATVYEEYDAIVDTINDFAMDMDEIADSTADVQGELTDILLAIYPEVIEKNFSEINGEEDSESEEEIA